MSEDIFLDSVVQNIRDASNQQILVEIGKSLLEKPIPEDHDIIADNFLMVAKIIGLDDLEPNFVQSVLDYLNNQKP